ncbi:response regulator receiver domain-containing protein [Roseimicrobium gellanilyticum]|uniref:Response regulator receiver domain-containing protein n=1 Tax=Roseimicrobium gellanilyticum TaxID=748857 RepID=A0A366H0T0_9BACT|nr:response regulator [Roseimicrobium gellanilyticum]RBP35345.1 response regulator receiver domain-containing protein [Roseimicrobium gellanilyticum]
MMATAHRIVIVEDDPGMSQAVERLLGAAGYPAISFANAESFLEASPTEQFCCYVFDIRLTGMSGLDLAERLHQSGDLTPFILMTAHDDEARQSHPAMARASALFTKPFSGREFVAAIRGAALPEATGRSP